MTDVAPKTLPEAARQLGLSPRALRHAIRAGHVPGPATATATLPPDWLATAKTALETAPKHLGPKQKVAPFARYEGTSAWRKYRVRVRAYAQFKAEIQAGR